MGKTRGAGLLLAPPKKTAVKVSSPGATLGYIEERDHSRWAKARLSAMSPTLHIPAAASPFETRPPARAVAAKKRAFSRLSLERERE